MHHATRVVLGLLVSLLIPSIAGAQAFPTLTSVAPQGGQRGTAVSITLTGERLAGATGVVFDSVDISGAVSTHSGQKAVSFSGDGVSGHIPDAGMLVAEVAIAADSPVGIHTVRVATPDGVSNAVSFVVGDVPELSEAEPNDSMDTAAEVALPVTVSGTVTSVDDEDLYRFAASEGDRLLCMVTASQMGSPLDSYLRLLDADGEEVANNDLGNALDSLIDYTAPADGWYTLSIRDRRFQGSARHVYRLSVGAMPYLDEVFPLGGRRGTDASVAVVGRNLGGIASMTVAIAPDAALGTRDARVTVDNGLTTNAARFAIGDLPEMVETEPNNDAAGAEVTAPVTINGKIAEDGDIDRFTFAAEAGQRLALEVNAGRLGSKLDGLLTLTRAVAEPPSDDTADDEQAEEKPAADMHVDDGPVAVNDDALGADPRIDHTFAEEGRYTVEVRDLNGRGGSDFAYRLSIAPLRPDFRVSAVPAEGPRPDVPSRGVLRVAPGGSAVLAVDVSRIDGFAESVRFEFRGLSDDFVVSSTIVGPGQTRGLLTLTAPWDAATGTLPISVVGVAAVNGARVEIVADPTPVLLTVTSAPRFTLEVAEAALVVGQGKDAWLHVGAARANGFAGPIAVSIVGLPGLARATSVTIPATERTTTVAVHAWTVPSRNPVVSVPVAGTYAISAKGSATIDGEPVTAYAPAIPITIAPAPFVVNAEPARQSFLLPAEAAADDAAVDGGTVTEAASDEPDEGMGATFTITITRQGGFSDAVDITLADLPDGLTASVASVQAGENDASITLTATAALATGEHSIRFRGSATIDGSDFAQDSQVVVIKVIR